MNPQQQSPTRRQILTSSSTTLAAASAVGALPEWARGAAPEAKPVGDGAAPARKLKVGIVGVGGRGWAHVREVAKLANADVVALCDVDSQILAKAAQHVPSAETFVDYREMLKQPGLEAVLVSTPDHTHAVIASAALKAGKHVYCEKPLCHTVREARALTELAEQSGLCTQMGIQIHAGENYRRVIELVRAGAIGKCGEVHVWNDRRNRPAAKPQSAPPSDPPPTLNYDLWLGPADRPFQADYHPYNWRRYWAFGSGLLGDIACHLVDVPFWALDLKYPTRVETEGAPLDEEITTEWTIARYEFPARGEQPPVKLTWYDPPKLPAAHASWGLPEKLASEGVMFVGEDGRMLFTNYGQHLLLPEAKFADYQRPAPSIPPSPGHQAEWVNACLAGDPSATSTPFRYGGPLTEAALLGVVAFRTGKALEWDGAACRATNAPEAERFLTYKYRDGWSM